MSSFVRKALFTKIKYSAARAWIIVPHLLSVFNYGWASTQGLYKEAHTPKPGNMNTKIQINPLSVQQGEKSPNCRSESIW